VIQTLPQVDSIGDIPTEYDPRLVDGPATRRRRLAQLSAAQRGILVLERYPELRLLPNIDWQRLSARATYRMLFGESSRHFAQLQLATLAGVVACAGISAAYASEADAAVRGILDLLQQRFAISTPLAITLDVWEAWGRDTDLMRTLTMKLRMYAAAVDYHLADYRERLTGEDRARVAHLLLPAIPRQFWRRFVPAAEHRAEVRRRRKAKTDVVSECALAILALMLARYPSAERFVCWYRRQIERIEAGELSVPALLTYEDDELDLPRQPGPDAMNVADLRWRITPVRLKLTIPSSTLATMPAG